MTNISTEIAGELIPAPMGNLIMVDTPPWYAILWDISIVGGLFTIIIVWAIARIARKHGKPIHTLRTILMITTWLIIGIGLTTCLLGIAQSLTDAVLMDLRPATTSMLLLGIANILKLTAISIGLAILGGAAWVTIKEDPQQAGPGYPPQGVGSPDP